MINSFSFLPKFLDEAYASHSSVALESYVAKACRQSSMVESALIVLLEMSEDGTETMLSIAEKIRKGQITTI